MEFFIIDRNGQQAGPFSFDQLVQKGISPETLVWKQDMADWTPAWKVENLRAVLEEAGSGLDKIIKTTCFMADMKDFAAMNAIYAEYFDGEFPSRSAVQVAALPKGALLEIEAIAYIVE